MNAPEQAPTTTRENWRTALRAAFERDGLLTFMANGIRCGAFPDGPTGLMSWSDWLVQQITHELPNATAIGEAGPVCQNCGKLVEVGQVVLPWDDAGEMHADCKNPYSLTVEQLEGQPAPCLLLGSPMRQIPVSKVAEPCP